MGKVRDLTGKKFGLLTVIEYVGSNKNKKRIYKCKCKCGNYTNAISGELINGGKKSCGCLKTVRGKEKYINLVGKKFGKYTVIAETQKRKPTKFICKCECGNIVEVLSANLINGHSKGCKRCSMKTHNMSQTRFYRIWKDMKCRCYNKNFKYYHCYGGRGITMCKEWLEFENFKKDMYESYLKHSELYSEKDTTIERINVNGNYEPSNCKWATMLQQSRNRRAEQHTIKGVTKTFSQWCQYANLKYGLVYQRVHTLGESLERALRLDEK